MAKAILVNATDVPFTASCLLPDNGLASLAACLIEAGHDVQIVDASTARTLRDHVTPGQRQHIQVLRRRLQEGKVDAATVAEMRMLDEEIGAGLQRVYQRIQADLDARISAAGVTLLGLKLWFGAGSEAGLRMAWNLSRRHPQLKVFAGGPLATLAPRRVLQGHPVVRAICVGEGERTIVGLAEYCDGTRKLDTIPNLVYLDGGVPTRTETDLAELDDLPLPCYREEVYPTATNGEQIPVHCLSESRGCPMRCPFCAHRSLSGGRWRTASAERVVETMVDAHRRWGVRHFRFSGSFTPARLFRRVADRLIELDADLRFSGFSHVNDVRVDDLPRLQQAGLRALFLGIESGSDELLAGSLGKKTTASRIREVVGACMDAGIFVSGSIIHPAPGETQQSRHETLQLLLDLFSGRDAGAVPVLPPLPEPGSLWWERMESYGFEGDRDRIIDALCRRRVRMFLPMNMFEPLPYSLDGRDYREVTARTASLTAELRGAGIMVNLGDDTVLIGLAAGHRPREIYDISHEIFACADAECLEELIARTRGARAPAHP